MTAITRAMIVVSTAMLVGCATSRDADFFFETWVGRTPATPKEQGDGQACYAETIAKVPAAFRGGLVAAGPTTRYKSCLREKGYTLDMFELNEKGEWVKR